MEALDNWDANSALQAQSASWAAYPIDGYMNMLDENVSDSETSLDSRTAGLFFENVNVKSETEPVVDSRAFSQHAEVPMAGQVPWNYANYEIHQAVTSPTSESDDTTRYSAAAPNCDSSDDQSGVFEECTSDDSEESDSSGMVMSGGGNESSGGSLSPSGRPVRMNARGEQMKQVQDMIRQVNSAVESTPKAARAKENPKKRARVEPDIRSVTLTREQLLTMTSEELDEFTERLKADHTLTPHELRELKRQRRLIKNREYAQASRVKKKVVLSDLGTKFSELESERNALLVRVQVLEEENAELRQRLGISQPSSSSSSSSSSASSSPFKFSNHSNHSNPSGSSHIAAFSAVPTFAPSSSPSDYPFQPPKVKRARGRSNSQSQNLATHNSLVGRVALVGGGVSLFAIVLLAVAFFNGAGSGFTSPFWSSPPSSYPAHHVSAHLGAQDPHSQSQDFKADNGYSTFRTMDILATSETPPDSSSSSSSDSATLHNTAIPHVEDLNKKEQDSLEASSKTQTTMLTMDDLLASEDIVLSSQNVTLSHSDHDQAVEAGEDLSQAHQA